MLHDHPQDFILYTRIHQGLQGEDDLTWGWSSESSFSNLGIYQIPQHVDYWLAALPLGRCSSWELAFRSKALTQWVMNYRPFPLQFSNRGLSFSEMDNFHTLCINDSTRLLINTLLFHLYLPVPSSENSLMVKKKKKKSHISLKIFLLSGGSVTFLSFNV